MAPFPKDEAVPISPARNSVNPEPLAFMQVLGERTQDENVRQHVGFL